MGRTKICIPLKGGREEELLREAEALSAHPLSPLISIVEFRDDLSEGISDEALPAFLHLLSERLPGKSLLFTLRSAAQGGAFPGDFEAYLLRNEAALKAEGISLIDLELPRDARKEGKRGERCEEEAESSRRERIRLFLERAKARGLRAIASYHDFEKTEGREKLLQIYRDLRALGGDILKLSLMPRKPEDVLSLLSACRAFREEDRERHEYIAVSMGQLGRFSRIAGQLSGSDYSFASLFAPSAPGQWRLEEMESMLSLLER